MDAVHGKDVTCNFFDSSNRREFSVNVERVYTIKDITQDQCGRRRALFVTKRARTTDDEFFAAEPIGTISTSSDNYRIPFVTAKKYVRFSERRQR